MESVGVKVSAPGFADGWQSTQAPVGYLNVRRNVLG